jgi:hypothetical protein
MNAHAQAVLLSNDQYAKMYRTDPKFNMYLHVLKTCTGHGDVSKKDPLYTPYKHGVLGITYGVGPKKYYRTMVDDFDIHYTQDECFDIYTTIKRKCPEFSELQRTMQELAESQGYIRDDFGAIYYMDPGKMYAAVNKYCQGCAGNVLKWWWLRVDELTEGGLDYVFNTVHDELDMAIHKDAGAQERLDGYCNVLDGLTIFELPIVAETSGLVTNWGEAG